jgi:hypothetical protein
MAAGGVMAVSDRRYRLRVKEKKRLPRQQQPKRLATEGKA